MNIKLRNNLDSQMILLSGVMIAILILSMSIVSINLSRIGTDLSLEKNISPLDEYINIRTTFLRVFNISCGRNNDSSMIRQAFNYTEVTLLKIDARYGHYFDASIVEIKVYDDRYLNVTADFKFVCSNTVIEERVNIPVYVTA